MLRSIVAVFRRIADDDDLYLESFEAEGLADQFIDMLYEAEWQWLTDHKDIKVSDEVLAAGKDAWLALDKLSTFPTFYKVEHRLWNQVPPTIARIPVNLPAEWVVFVNDAAVTRTELVYHPSGSSAGAI
jgi:hypothetical protein